MASVGDRLRDHTVALAVSLGVAFGVSVLSLRLGVVWGPFLSGVYLCFVCFFVAWSVGSPDDRETEWEWGDPAGDNWWNWSEASPSTTRDADAPSLDALQQRYAAGELTDEQFDRHRERRLDTDTLEAPEDCLKARELMQDHDRSPATPRARLSQRNSTHRVASAENDGPREE
jgi:hypothetical protein